MWTIITLSIIIVVLVALLSLSIYRIVQLVNIVDQLGLRVEKSLDILDKAYSEIGYVAKTEIMSDEPLIRQVVEAIKSSQTAVLQVANELVEFGDGEE